MEMKFHSLAKENFDKSVMSKKYLIMRKLSIAYLFTIEIKKSIDYSAI